MLGAKGVAGSCSGEQSTVLLPLCRQRQKGSRVCQVLGLWLAEKEDDETMLSRRSPTQGSFPREGEGMLRLPCGNMLAQMLGLPVVGQC